MPSSGSSDYYTHNAERILAGARLIMDAARQSAVELFGMDEAEHIVPPAMQRFERMLPEIPYIGGDANRLTPNLINGVVKLCLYKEMKARGYANEAIGHLLYKTIKAHLASPSQPLPPGKEQVDQIIASIQRAAEITPASPYAYDWHTTFVEGDGETFDWGVDYTTCGVCKLFKEQDAADFLPYLCFLDLPAYQARGIGLVRTGILALGGECCDFRFNLRGEYRLEWTPDFFHADP